MERVAIAVTAKVGFDDRPPPKFKVPNDPAREFINISDGRTGGGSGSHPLYPFSLSRARVSRGGGPRTTIAFLPLPAASSFERRRSHIAPREALLRDNHPRDFSQERCRCHCTALGEGHYSEQGEPVTSAPTPAIDPTPVGRGCNAPDVHCRFSR